MSQFSQPDELVTAVVALTDLRPELVSKAGGKGAKLGDMLRDNLPVPPGFVVTTDAFRAFLQNHSGNDHILKAMDGLDVNDDQALQKAADVICEFIDTKPLPADLIDSITTAYNALGDGRSAVAVRSSAGSEDGTSASYAGQQETFLNVRGTEEVLRRVAGCWASFFTPRALFYRAQKGSLKDTEIAVVVQEMVDAEKSGVLFTVDPIQGRRDRMIIEAIYGLGEAVVSGMVTPDHLVVNKSDGSIANEHITVQKVAIVYDEEKGGIKEIALPEDQGKARVLTDTEIKRLYELSLQLEEKFGGPQDIEWCIRRDKVYLLQSRPVTTL